MEIFVLRDGQQTGPFSEDTVQSLCQRGSLASSDMAWHKGLPGWLPLTEVLKPGSERPVAPPPVPATSGIRPAPKKGATAKQKALLKYIGATHEEDITKEDAALAISDAMENPKFTARLQKWGEEKLRLHPDVFQDELDHRRAHRVGRYLERCQSEASEAVKDVTKAHVQVLVESLDKRNPTWESQPREALWEHLLPAIADHFPQLVQEGWKGRLKPGGSKVAAAMTAGELPLETPVPGPFSAAIRGVVYGGAVLGLILGGNYLFNKSGETGAAAKPTAKQAPTPAPEPPALPKVPAHPTEAPLIAANPADAAAPGINAEANAVPPVAVEPVPAAPVAAVPAAPAPAAAADPNMAAAAAPASVPPAPAASSPVNPAVALNTPPAPAPPGLTPATPAAAASAEPVLPGVKSLLTITRPVQVQLQFGKVTLNTGTRVRYIALEGQNVRVNFNNNVILVPSAATDVDPNALPPAPVPASAPPAAVPATPAPTTAPPKAPKPSSDF